jgi:hypothetical protein
MSGITVVVITWNSEPVIASCLESCRKYPVILIDNASADGTLWVARGFQNVRVTANECNRGFSAAVNQGIEQCATEFVLLLNPDVTLLSGVEPLAEACAREGVGAAAGQLVDSSGQPQRGFGIRGFPRPITLIFEVLGINRVFPWNPVNRQYRELRRNVDERGEVDQPAGAFLMLRREVWSSLKGFDETFFPVWFEDVDFCRRAHDAGYKAIYDPAVKGRHQGGHSIGSLPGEYRELYWYVSLLRYAVKHYRPAAFRAVSAAVAPGALLRAIISLFAGRGAAVAAAYCKVAWFAGGCLVSGRLPGLPAPLCSQVATVSKLTGSGQVTPSARNI